MLRLFRHRLLCCRLPLFPFVLLFLAPALRAAEAVETKTYEVKIHRDVTYFEGEEKDKAKHQLDLYLPQGKQDFPVLFFVHGGSWLHGDKAFMGIYSGLGRFYASQGIGVVVINYRLSPGVQHPEHIKDVARAFAWTIKNIASYGGQPEQVFVSGHSAGGHLAALLATDETYLKAESLSFKNIKGVVAISGCYDVPAQLLPQVFGTEIGIGKRASPTYQVKAGVPPFLLLYAEKDLKYCDKPAAQGFYEALQSKECPATIGEIADSNHIKILLQASVANNLVSNKILAFIQTPPTK